MKKVIYSLFSLLLIMVNVSHAADVLPNQFLIYQQRLNSKWWLNSSYLNNGFTFDSADAEGRVYNRGNTNIYHVELFRFFPNKNLVVSVLYKRLSTNSETYSVIGLSTSNGSVKISGNLFGLNIKKVFAKHFYLATYGVYGPTQYQSTVTNIAGTGVTGIGSTTYDGNFWYVGANTGALIPLGTRWLLGGILNFVYVESTADPYTMTQTNLPTITQSRTSITTANLLQDFVLKYLINQHVRPFINAGLIEILSHNVSNASALLRVPTPNLLLGRFGYHVGGGLELTFQKASFYFGYLYNQRESTFHSNSAYARLSFFT